MKKDQKIEIIDLPGLGFVWGLSRLYLFSGRADLKIALALVGCFTLLLGEATEELSVRQPGLRHLALLNKQPISFQDLPDCLPDSKG